MPSHYKDKYVTPEQVKDLANELASRKKGDVYSAEENPEEAPMSLEELKKQADKKVGEIMKKANKAKGEATQEKLDEAKKEMGLDVERAPMPKPSLLPDPPKKPKLPKEIRLKMKNR
jgi:hypothetical protein